MMRPQCACFHILVRWGINANVQRRSAIFFYGNCVLNGILPVKFDNDVVEDLVTQIESDPANNLIKVDLTNCTVTFPHSSALSSEISSAPGFSLFASGLGLLGWFRHKA
jgi:3-isopropylmalate dehydratase small subunit